MDIRKQAEKAEQFRKLHHGPRLLLLPNAWDVVSARILEECGHPAIATSSAAVAFSLGYPDGQRISREEMLEVAGRIARAVDVPVTADLEAGYGTSAKDMVETVEAAIAELEKMGVARVSAGSGVMRAALGLVRRIGKEMFESRSCETMFAGSIPHSELNRMMMRRASGANA